MQMGRKSNTRNSFPSSLKITIGLTIGVILKTEQKEKEEVGNWKHRTYKKRRKKKSKHGREKQRNQGKILMLSKIERTQMRKAHKP